MAEQQIRFDDGAAYERMMGTWSRLAGDIFLDWLAPRPGLRWIDIGCGSGAFTELLVERCAPTEVQGIDPSEAQLAFARARPAARLAQFRRGDATALPFPDGRFDGAVMALVIFFVPAPAKGVAEMVRVVQPGGTVATYAWDMEAADIPGSRSMQRCARWASSLCSRQASAHRGWRPCGICGPLRASMRSKRGRSQCSGHSPISMISG
jgi:ubiquinone/menaquinone biosynthesis C-methylase UbiE